MEEQFSNPEDFYKTYPEHREYVSPQIRKKHRRDFGKNIWEPCGFKPGISVLEIGCGTGLFLAYIEGSGIVDFVGIDSDPKVLDYMPETLSENVQIFIGCFTDD